MSNKFDIKRVLITQSPDNVYGFCIRGLGFLGELAETICGWGTSIYCNVGKTFCEAYPNPEEVPECTGFLGNECIYPPPSVLK